MSGGRQLQATSMELHTANDILDSLRFQIEWYDYVLNNNRCDDANKVLVYEGIRQALQSFVTRIVEVEEDCG